MRDNPEPIVLEMMPEQPDTKAGLQNTIDNLEANRRWLADQHEDLRIQVISLTKELANTRSEKSHWYSEAHAQKDTVEKRDAEIERLKRQADLLEREHKGYKDAMDHALRVALGKR